MVENISLRNTQISTHVNRHFENILCFLLRNTIIKTGVTPHLLTQLKSNYNISLLLKKAL